MSRYAPQRPVRRATVTATAVLGACAALVTAGPGTALAEGTGATGSFGARYVALGDSYASGFGIIPVEHEACGRGKANYPHVLRTVYKSKSYTNAACGGATTRSIWNAHKGEPPQIKALKPDTTLVTVSVGGNDIGFEKIVTECAFLGVQQPTGAPCQSKFKGGLEDDFKKLEPRIASVVIDIKRKSPKATVVLVGYPALVPASGATCDRSEVPFAAGDFSFLHGTLVRLNTMIEEQARKAGAVYADTYKPSVGYHMCASDDKRMIQPLLADGRVAPAAAHPNLRGIIRMGGTISQVLAKHAG
ncbi:SGNH/GDSL hydrolase family protein [Nonomuraea sp. NPDC049480]|uniref:SGNH/GDSL hydrolase family protein n=1 Tax=Nonomuraea sp. NPDC049480 TaxID=3364353 RepID=UPI00378FB0E4